MIIIVETRALSSPLGRVDVGHPEVAVCVAVVINSVIILFVIVVMIMIVHHD